MFTVRSSVVLAMTAFLMLFSAASASPVGRARDQNNNVPIQQYNVPITVGASALPSPNGTLKAITLGRGTQNYTCDTASGAPRASITVPQGTQLLNLLPEFLINFSLSLVQRYSIRVLGYHYFNAAGKPTFDLGDTGFFVGKKVGSITAPSDAYVGQFGIGYGAVDWLKLADAGGSVGISQVYRVVTAGGKQMPSCTTAGPFQVEYAALYWFYQ